MTKTFLKILLFPLDLVFLTVDSCIITFRRIKRLLKREKDQPCHLCQGDDHSDTPHPVRSVLKYRNEWMVKLLAPCVRFKRIDGRRIALCRQEGGFTRPPAAAPLLAVFLILFWMSGCLGALLLVSSNPESFLANFVTFFDPGRLESGEEEPDFLELDETRFNPERAERYFLSGVKSLDQGKVPKAQVEFKNAIQYYPTDPKLHFHLARALLATGQVVEGESSLRKTLEFDPDHVEALLLLARRMERKENRGQALEFAGRALELEPENIEALRLNAGLLASRGDRGRVRVLADRLLELNGENPNTLSFLGRLELSLFNNLEVANERLRAALDLNPDHLDALLAMIPIHARENRIDKVDENLEHVLRLDPDNLQALRLQAELQMSRYGLPVGIRAYRNLLNTKFGGNMGLRLRYAELLLQSGNITEGKRLARELTASGVPAVQRSAHWMLAQMYGQIRMHDEAIQHARDTLRLVPDARNVQVFLARQFMLTDEMTQAKRMLQTAMSGQVDDAGLISLMTQVMVQLDERDEALALLESKIAENPDMDALRMRKVEILMQSEDWRDALSDTLALHEKYPDNPALKNNLAFLLARGGTDLERASALVEELRESFSDNPVIMDTYGYVLAARGDHAGALEVYEEALKQASANVTIRYHYARSLAALGRNDDALRQLEAILMIDPSFPQAEEARALRQNLSSGA